MQAVSAGCKVLVLPRIEVPESFPDCGEISTTRRARRSQRVLTLDVLLIASRTFERWRSRASGPTWRRTRMMDEASEKPVPRATARRCVFKYVFDNRIRRGMKRERGLQMPSHI